MEAENLTAPGPWHPVSTEAGQGMALIAFLRGVNVGGHRRLRPSVLARALRDYDVVSVGTAGTFIVRGRVSRAAFRAALLEQLPFEADVALCDGREVLRLERAQPFGSGPSRAGVVRFVSVLPRARRLRTPIPAAIPPTGRWFVRVLGSHGPFVFGVYRRHMKTIGYLGGLDELLGVDVTTRSWSTIVRIAGLLQARD